MRVKKWLAMRLLGWLDSSIFDYCVVWTPAEDITLVPQYDPEFLPRAAFVARDDAAQFALMCAETVQTAGDGPAGMYLVRHLHTSALIVGYRCEVFGDPRGATYPAYRP